MSRTATKPTPTAAANQDADDREFKRLVFMIQTRRQYNQMTKAVELGLALRLLNYFIEDGQNPSGKMFFLLQCVVASEDPACFIRLVEWVQSTPDQFTEFRDAVSRAMTSRQMQPKLQALLDRPECQAVTGRPPPLRRRQAS
jgi:hypothetical protein